MDDDEGMVAMLAFTGYAKDPETGQSLAPLGIVSSLPGLDELVATGVLEQTNWGGYPLTYLGPADVFLGWLANLPGRSFGSTIRSTKTGSAAPRWVSGPEVKDLAIEALRALDPQRRIRVDFWDES